MLWNVRIGFQCGKELPIIAIFRIPFQAVLYSEGGEVFIIVIIFLSSPPRIKLDYPFAYRFINAGEQKYNSYPCYMGDWPACPTFVQTKEIFQIKIVNLKW